MAGLQYPMSRWPHSLPALFLLVCATLGACASSDKASRKTDPAASASPTPGPRPYTPIREAGREEEDDVRVELAKGYLDERHVDGVLDARAQALIACHRRAGRAFRVASGEVGLRIFVTSYGEVANVWVTSSLGSFDVERCLVEEGRRMVFPPPEGQRPTDFTYSLRFLSRRGHPVVEWRPEEVAKNVDRLRPTLATCGRIGAAPVSAVAYIEPGGRVLSVGLASEGPIDATAATCVVEQVRRNWRLPCDRDHVVRTSFLVQAR